MKVSRRCMVGKSILPRERGLRLAGERAGKWVKILRCKPPCRPRPGGDAPYSTRASQ